jgi:hypothetical protein
MPCTTHEGSAHATGVKASRKAATWVTMAKGRTEKHQQNAYSNPQKRYTVEYSGWFYHCFKNRTLQ